MMPGAFRRSGHFFCGSRTLKLAPIREIEGVNEQDRLDRMGKLARIGGGIALLAIAGLAACTKAPPPPPAPPPVVVIPPMPTPPNNAPLDMTIPPVAADGQRQTVNYGISTSQAVWNLRSAYNVAALNCPEVQYAPILEGYKRFLKVYAKQLDRANREIDRSFRTQHAGRAAIVARESYQTQVYNFFSLPPVDTGFCQAAMDVTGELATIEPDKFESYSYVGLAKMEAPFKEFFAAYERYRADLAAWQSRYGNAMITVRPAEGQAVGQAAGPAAGQTQTVVVPQQTLAQPGGYNQ